MAAKRPKIAMLTRVVYKTRRGPQPYVPIERQVNERSLKRRARYEQLLDHPSSACDCPCHTSQVNECFCTPSCVRGEPEE